MDVGLLAFLGVFALSCWDLSLSEILGQAHYCMLLLPYIIYKKL
jgi:hypothetical protein